ncbi:MAG: hypothetical protein R3Y05_03940 [bacterium]
MKVKIHYTLYIFFLLSFFCNLFIETIIMFALLLVHELGHLIFLIKYKREITSITFYPFGGIIKHSNNCNSELKEDFFIYFGGVFMNIILLFVFNILNLELFNILNCGIIIFNILPIFPLDGAKILKTIISTIICYKKTLYLTLFISISSIVLLILFNFYYIKSIYLYLLIISLIKMNFDYFKNIKKEYKIFLTNKYIYYNDKLKTKEIKRFKNPVNKLFIGRNNLFILDELKIKEEEILRTIFT